MVNRQPHQRPKAVRKAQAGLVVVVLAWIAFHPGDRKNTFFRRVGGPKKGVFRPGEYMYPEENSVFHAPTSKNAVFRPTWEFSYRLAPLRKKPSQNGKTINEMTADHTVTNT